MTSIAPVITVIGDNPKTIQALTTYSDPKSTATDNYDNSVNVTSSGTVNTSIVGSYTANSTVRVIVQETLQLKNKNCECKINQFTL